MNNIIYNIDYNSYLTLLASVENKFNIYKKELQNNGVSLYHPSQIDRSTLSDHHVIINKLFPKESSVFYSPSNFLNSLYLLNYHLGSVLMISKIDSINRGIQTVSISSDDLLIIESFRDL